MALLDAGHTLAEVDWPNIECLECPNKPMPYYTWKHNMKRHWEDKHENAEMPECLEKMCVVSDMERERLNQCKNMPTRMRKKKKSKAKEELAKNQKRKSKRKAEASGNNSAPNKKQASEGGGDVEDVEDQASGEQQEVAINN